MNNHLVLPNGAVVRPSQISSVIPWKSSMQISMLGGASTNFDIPADQIPAELARISKAMENAPSVKIELEINPEEVAKAISGVLRDAMSIQGNGYYHFGNNLVNKIGASVKDALSESLRIHEFTTSQNKTLGMAITSAIKDACRAAIGKTY